MYIYKYINIFRHLKLEIASAIPASNDEKYDITNSAGQGLTWKVSNYCCLSLHHETRTQCCCNVGCNEYNNMYSKYIVWRYFKYSESFIDKQLAL